MHISDSMKVAIAGALWFALVAVVCLPLVMSLQVALRPKGATDVANMASSSAVLFGAPAGLLGGLFANRIAATETTIRAIGLGALLILCTNVLAAFWLAILGGQSSSFVSIVQSFMSVLALYLVFDIVFLFGAPFVLGALASLAFRAAVGQRGWAR
jgi:hypothetical protein